MDLSPLLTSALIQGTYQLTNLMHKFLFYNKFVVFLYMFRALLCSSSGLQVLQPAERQKKNIFSLLVLKKSPENLLGSTSLLFNMYQIYIPGLKQPARETFYSLHLIPLLKMSRSIYLDQHTCRGI